jgi:superfamily II DNA/RNA helicase
MTEQQTYQNIDYEDFDEPLYQYHNGALLKGVYEYFEKPSVIQAKCMKPIADGRDLIAQAQSGSGKTGAFVIGALMKVNPEIKTPQAVILASTRELASQIKDVTYNLGKFIGEDKSKLKVTLCVGGIQNENNKTENNLKEASNSHILVCTPGRLNGLLKVSKDLFNNLKIFIFDEADQLLSKDFIEQTQNIIKLIPKKTQMCLFSATTQTQHIQNTKKYFMSNPVELYIDRDKIKVDQIKNYYIRAEKENNKYSIIVDLYKNISICQAVIFVNTIDKASELASRLRKDGQTVGLIHRKLPDIERMEIIKKFKKTHIRILVATDIIARGIDVQQVGLVINYDIPFGEGFAEQYIHRVGRSGRFGKLGVAINLLTDDKSEEYRIRDISKKYGIKFTEMPILQDINNYLGDVNGYSFKKIENDE